MGVQKETRKLLVTGCGRSGTFFAAALWQTLGLDIRHEQPVPPNGVMGKDGVASWFLAVDDPEPPSGPAPHLYRFDVTIHQVRQPLQVIASVAQYILKTGKYAPGFIERNLPEVRLSSDEEQEFSEKEKLILKAGRYWVHWNRKAEKKADLTIRVEDIEQILPELCDLLGTEYKPDVPTSLPKNLNGRHHYLKEEPWVVDWKLLRKLDPKLTDEIRELATRYGYNI